MGEKLKREGRGREKVWDEKMKGGGGLSLLGLTIIPNKKIFVLEN